MSIIGIINLVIFVLLIVKFGFGKGIGYLLGMWFVPAICGLLAGVVAFFVVKSFATAKLIGCIVQLVVTILRLKSAVDDIRN